MERKSNPYAKPPWGPIAGKLIGFTFAGCLDQLYCLAAVTKDWHVRKCWRRTEYTEM
jgi:hypothetical protein